MTGNDGGSIHHSNNNSYSRRKINIVTREPWKNNQGFVSDEDDGDPS